MTASTPVAEARAPGADGKSASWTCPFCSLLCDDFSVDAGAELRLRGSNCARAQAGLAQFGADLATVSASIDGASASTDAALDAAATRIAAARQPLFGGLATDVAGMRALYALADASGAILDHAHGDTLMHSLRALQDKGLFYTTLAEIRNRADLVVCLGTDPRARYPEFFRRCAPAAGSADTREVVFLASKEADSGVEVTGASRVEHLSADGDLFDVAARLAARLSGRQAAADEGAGDELGALAARMQAARYCVIVWEAGTLPRHGALIGEAVLRMVNTLNRSTRAGAFCLTGSEGAYSANYVSTWMSGLPLRSGVFARGLEHDPVRFAATRLLADGAVDALLWVSSFGAEPAVPASALPTVVLGHPAQAKALAGRSNIVFIPVSTPGIGSAGHLFRADGGVVVPLDAVRDDGLPTVAALAAQLRTRVRAIHNGEGAR